MSDLVDRLIAMKPRSYGPAGLFDLLGDAAAEVADLTKANMLLHAIVSNREEEISGLRAQLASASERVAEMQYEAGMYHSLYDVATERLASARKALEPFAAIDFPEVYSDRLPILGIDRLIGGLTLEHLRAAKSALTDEKGQS